MINSKTEKLEGTWSFISFCSSEEGQRYVFGCPVNKDVYDKVYEDRRALYESAEESYTYYPISQKRTIRSYMSEESICLIELLQYW